MLQSQNIQFSIALPILGKSERKNHVNYLGHLLLFPVKKRLR